MPARSGQPSRLRALTPTMRWAAGMSPGAIREVAVAVLLAAEIAAPRCVAVGTVVQGATPGDALGAVAGAQQRRARRRSAHLS